MAEKKEGKRGSLLKSAVVASPFVGATAHSIYKGVRATRAQHERVGVPSIQQVIRNSKISALQERVTSHVNVDFLNDLIEKGVVKDGTSIHKMRTAWDQAIRETSAFDLSKLPKEMKSLQGLPDIETIDTLKRFSKNSSKLNQQIFNRFKRNWRALSPKSNTILDFQAVAHMTLPTITDRYQDPLSPRLYNMLSNMVGGEENLRAQFFTSPGYAERGLGMFDVKLAVGGLPVKFNLPTLDPTGQFLVEGLTQSSRRIHTQVGIIDPLTGAVTKMNRDEYFLQELQKSIIPDIKSGRLKTMSDVQRATSSLYETVFGSLESVPNIDPDKLGPAAKRYQEVRSSALQLLVENKDRTVAGKDFAPAFRVATSEEAVKAIKQHGFFAGTGTHIGEGIVQQLDVTQEHLFPEAIDWARKPESGIRRFDLTKESVEALGPGRRSFTRMGDETLATPVLRTLYVDQSKIEELGLFGEGHALGRRSLSNELEFQWGQDIHLKAIPSMPFEDFQKAIAEGKFKPGDILGWDTSGEAIEMTEEMRLLSAQANRTVGQGDFVTLSVINRRRLLNNEKFHGDFKALLRLQRDENFNHTAKKLAGRSRLFDNIDTIVTMDELKKDPAKFAKQVFTGMSDVAQNDRWMAPNKTVGSHWQEYQTWLRHWTQKNEVLENLKSDPDEWSNILRMKATQGVGWDNEEFVRSGLGLASNMNMRPEDVAAVFGAAPTVIGKEKTAQLLEQNFGAATSRKILEEMNRGIAVGRSEVAYGGPEELRGAGTRGSLEPRSYEVFQGPGFKGIGDDISRDLVQRSIYTDPTTLRTSQGLARTAESIAGLIKPKANERVVNLADIAGPKLHQEVQKLIESGGGWMRPGQGVSDIFIPNIAEMESLRPVQTGAGKQIYGDVANYYHRLAEEGARLHSGVDAATPAEVKAGLNTIMQELHREAAPGGKGQGAWLRNKVAGSRFLTGVDKVTEGAKDLRLFEVGLPGKMADKMFNELADLNIYNAEALGQMRSRFEAGEAIGGLLGRHPMFAEHSIQQVMFRKVAGNRPQIQIPEWNTKVAVEGLEGGVNLRLGPLVGMAGDKDADLFSATLVAPNIEGRIAKNLTNANSEYLHDYLRYQVRYQMMKAKKVGITDALPTIENMIGGAKKLAVVPEWVPKLSLQMSDARRAVRTFGQGAGAADAEMLLTWLEQTPISSKHLSASQAARGELGDMMAQLSSALETGDTRALREVVTDITTGNKAAEELLYGNVRLSSADAARIGKQYGIQNFNPELGGVNLDRALETIAGSKQKYMDSGLQRQAELLAGRGGAIRGMELPTFSGMIRASEEATQASFGEGLLKAVANKSQMLGNVSEMLMANKGKIGLGLAATLALGATLSSPRQSIGPGSAIIPPEGLIKRANSAGAGLTAPDVNPTPNRSVGQPQVPNLTPTNSVARVSMSSGRNMTVRGNISSGFTNKGISDLSRLAGSGSSGISVNLRDNRRRVDQYTDRNRR